VKKKQNKLINLKQKEERRCLCSEGGRGSEELSFEEEMAVENDGM
jgi:hypothetical protein